MNASSLALQATACRLRQDALDMIYGANSGHPGSSFSCIDWLVCLWLSHMRHQAQNPNWAQRDRFVMSKGHAAPALYAVLMEAGYIPKSEKNTLRQINSNLQGHPASLYVSGVDVSTGSLGQGLSCAVGMALGLRLQYPSQHQPDAPRVYTLLGDGECQEGNTWEAVMSAAHHKTNRLTAIIDRNQLQIDGDTECVKGLGNVAEKFAAFGWQVIEVMDGHQFDSLIEALDQADGFANDPAHTKPTCIVSHNVKGKGVSFMENQAGWHGKAPNAAEYKQASDELMQAFLRYSVG